VDLRWDQRHIERIKIAKAGARADARETPLH
jgi:hypothetical protein